jgi:hypothetical protein
LFYGYVLHLGFLDGVEGLIFHTLRRFWFRFLIDARIWKREHAAAPARTGPAIRQRSSSAAAGVPFLNAACSSRPRGCIGR